MPTHLPQRVNLKALNTKPVLHFILKPPFIVSAICSLRIVLGKPGGK
ncbi:hypothetical protein AWB67_06659 [Caballeronia terrestris]|jgi:hypothetical protein|uniref:Uncharacterized protein n=1 Tax=Caballeronia terrestris TaxID=1226301 RepID=A0A158KUF7_9BURK|nr:hypothetical protein AWB67_06659 [Caballeronia terrestris]